MNDKALRTEALSVGLEPPSFKDLLIPIPNSGTKKKNKKKKKPKAKKNVETQANVDLLGSAGTDSAATDVGANNGVIDHQASLELSNLNSRISHPQLVSANGDDSSLINVEGISSTDWQFTLESDDTIEHSPQCILSTSSFVDEAEFPVHIPGLEDATSSNMSPNSVQNNMNLNTVALGSSTSSKRKKKKKKKSKANSASLNVDDQRDFEQVYSTDVAITYRNGQALSYYNGSVRQASMNNNVNNNKSKDIWSSSNTEEREQIREFWLSLSESERRSLVKVEKEAVLQKMKEQQKYSCSCSVCGRKRLAIEEELEVLYDAYYEELEQYANIQRNLANTESVNASDEGSDKSQKGIISDSPKLLSIPLNNVPSKSLNDDITQDELNSSNADVDEEVIETTSLEEKNVDNQEFVTSISNGNQTLEDTSHSPQTQPPFQPPYPSKADEKNSYHSDLYNFGSSLTVKGGILTVADDLLKNDGKKFIEMMEQLAERRMQREDNSNFHEPELYESGLEYDEDEEEDEEDVDEDELDLMTDEQRMEEGRRMFQIFAARLFEQRVLQAYREKVAQQRQAKLLEEIEEENKRKQERELKKIREKEKKRDKKKQLKLAKEEERQRREAERLAEQAAQKALEAKRQEEARKKREEQRLKREQEKKQQELERQKREEKQKQKEREKKLKKQQQEADREKMAREQRLREEEEKRILEERKRREKLDKEEEERRRRELLEKESEEKERRLREAKIAAFFAPNQTKEGSDGCTTSSQLGLFEKKGDLVNDEDKLSSHLLDSVPNALRQAPIGLKNTNNLSERNASSNLLNSSLFSSFNSVNPLISLEPNPLNRTLNNSVNLTDFGRKPNGLHSPSSLLSNSSNFGLNPNARHSLSRANSPVHHYPFATPPSQRANKYPLNNGANVPALLNSFSSPQLSPLVNRVLNEPSSSPLSSSSLKSPLSKEGVLNQQGHEQYNFSLSPSIRNKLSPICRPSQGSSPKLKNNLSNTEERMGSRALLDDKTDSVITASNSTTSGLSRDESSNPNNYELLNAFNQNTWKISRSTSNKSLIPESPWGVALGAFTPNASTQSIPWGNRTWTD